MTEGKALKVRVTFAIILIGVVLMFTAVVTDHWAVLSPKVEEYNATCEMAHFGLWRICIKRIFMKENETDKEQGCGPISLPGEHNCSYFTHFVSGESTEIFEVSTQREYSISAAAIAIFSVVFSIIGTIIVLLSFRKKMDYLLRPASMFYTFSGRPCCADIIMLMSWYVSHLGRDGKGLSRKLNGQRGKQDRFAKQRYRYFAHHYRCVRTGHGYIIDSSCKFTLFVLCVATGSIFNGLLLFIHSLGVTSQV
uniref:Calcium voltage-gated channel auxiliary subunit gamma 1 n=1 Tax=Anolis carolinensis TaxID=28377 RepID=H9G3D6_ANOCA